MTPCAHPQAGPRLRIIANGATAVYKQCPDCGHVASQAIPKSSFTPEQLQAMPRFSEEAKEAYHATQGQISREQYEERERQKKEELVRRRIEYEAYLRSPEWRAIRQTVMERDGGIYQGCHDAKATDVHHLTYRHIFKELAFELIAVCRPCHDKAHEDEP